MLILKRIVHSNEFLKCKASQQILMYGDFYYQDNVDGYIISHKYYHQMLEQKRLNEFDYSKLNNATSEKEYTMLLRQAERDFLNTDMFEREILGKENGKWKI